MFMEFDWPLKWRHLGAKATYQCPIFKSTDNYLEYQYSQCIWDEETDKMIWWPPNILECNRKYRNNCLVLAF